MGEKRKKKIVHFVLVCPVPPNAMGSLLSVEASLSFVIYISPHCVGRELLLKQVG